MRSMSLFLSKKKEWLKGPPKELERNDWHAKRKMMTLARSRRTPPMHWFEKTGPDRNGFGVILSTANQRQGHHHRINLRKFEWRK
jgi:hypothetical protein